MGAKLNNFQNPFFLKEGFFCDNYLFLEDYENFILPLPLQRRGASGLIPEGVSLLKEGLENQFGASPRFYLPQAGPLGEGSKLVYILI